MSRSAKTKRKALVSLLCLFVLIPGICACSKKSTKYTISEDTEYVRPSTRELITDQALIDQLSHVKKYSVEFGTSELQSPVALIINNENEYDFGVTDLFETTGDLSEAKSILLMEARFSSSKAEENSTVMKYTPRCVCSVISRDCSMKSDICEFELDEDALYGYQHLYTPHFNEELDKKMFQALSETIKISASSDNVYVDVLNCLTGFDFESDIQILQEACESYDYPESENHENRIDAVDWELPFFLYNGLPKTESLESPDMSRYERPEDLFSSISSYCSVNESLEAWGQYTAGKSSRLIGLIEYIGGTFEGDYYFQGNSKKFRVYSRIYRCTIVDAGTSEVLGWYTNRSFKMGKEELVYSNIKEINGTYYYVKDHPENDFIDNVLGKKKDIYASIWKSIPAK